MRSWYKMGAYGYWFVLLPAQLTWLLQPLDVKVFGYVKAFLRRPFITVAEHSFDDRLILTAIRDVFTAVRKFFVERSWAKAFDTLGLNGGIPPSRKHILLECGWTVFPSIVRTRPTTEIICSNTPRGRTLHTDALRRCMPPADSLSSLLSSDVGIMVPPSLIRGDHMAIEPAVRRRRVLPLTFLRIDHDSDHDSE